jgi:hypothetical protein
MNFKRTAPILLLTYFILPYAVSQQKIIFNSNGKVINVVQYHPVDIVFTTNKMPAGNAFDIPFNAVFINENNDTLILPGFYNGQSEYIIRFCPENTGRYHYYTLSSVSSLSGLKGTVLAEKNTNPEIKGAVKVSTAAPQKFIYQNGQPYFALAFELDWLFALDAGSANGIPKTSEIIQAVKDNGFNQVVMNVYAYDVSWNVPGNVPQQYNFKKPAYSVFKGTNEQPEFSQLNISFFQHFDHVVQYLHEHGLVAHVMIYVWNKKVNWPQMFSAEDNRYFDYVIKRYQAYPNIIWDVSKEALDYGRCDIPYINERIERIHHTDAYKHLITVHDYEYCSREPAKVDFIAIQNWRSDLYSLSLEAFQKYADKPVMNIEHGGYEEGPYPSFMGNYISPEVCLERNYACVFAGVYSCYYWQNTSWDIVIYDVMNTKQSFTKPKFEYYKHLQTLFTRYNFNSLFPYKQKLTTNGRIGNDNLSSSGYSLTDNKGMYLYFVPAANYQTNVVIPKPASGKISATWFNIFTGETYAEAIADWQLFKSYQSPWKAQSSVLILEEK